MSEKTKIVLWDDVDITNRVDVDFINRCGGADPDHWANNTDPIAAAREWVDRKLKHLTRPDGCAAAVRWGSSPRWKRCSFRVAAGEHFCYHHGGKHPPSKAVLMPKTKNPKLICERLERHRRKLLTRVDELNAQIAQLDSRLGALHHVGS